MRPGTYSSRRRHDASKLLVIDRKTGRTQFASSADMTRFLRASDLLVANQSATIPGSLWGKRAHDKEFFEVRLAAFAGNQLMKFDLWWAVSFGAGSWRIPTEERGEAPYLEVGDEIVVSAKLLLKVIELSPREDRLFKVQLIGSDVLSELYVRGSPIQYSYHREKLGLWDIQTPLSQIPLSVEPPSALFPLTWQRLFSLEALCQTAFVHHGAGISSTGQKSLDALLPLPEFYWVPGQTRLAVEKTKRAGGRVIAIGTTVARALESAFESGSDSGITQLRLGPERPVQIVDGLLTGYHEPETSHFDLEASFLSRDKLMTAFLLAEQKQFLGHEYGDSVLII